MSKNRPPPAIVPQMSKMGSRSVPTKSGDSMSINNSGGNKSAFNKNSGTLTSTMTSVSVNVSQGTLKNTRKKMVDLGLKCRWLKN